MAGLSNNEILMNADGLVVNAFKDAPGRGDYFSGSSGTSEGQFLFILGMLDGYLATGNTKSLELAERALSHVLVTLYRNTPIPDQVSEQKIFAPHWLFSVKYAFNTSLIEYEYQVNFSNGVGVIPLDTVRYVYNARSLDAVYLWRNPYASLISGTMYPVASYTYIEGTGMRIQLQSAYNGPLKVTFSNQVGPEIAVNEPYEAWPDWRKLDATEIDAACDVFIWAYRAFNRAYQVTGNDTWNQAARATREQAAISIDLNDGRDWVKPTWTDSPFADGSRFSFVDRSPPPGFGVDQYGRVQIDIPQKLTGTGDVQYGKASIGDNYADGDATTVEIQSNKAVAVSLYIDLYQAYAPANRYAVVLNLSGAGEQTFVLHRTDFKNNTGAVLPSNAPVYTCGINSNVAESHVIWLKRIRQTPPRDIAYYPGAIPFTANFMGSPPMQIDWRGPIYMGYQAPDMWRIVGNPTAAVTCTQLLIDAQTAWVTQTGKTRGPFAPVFYFKRDDAVQYGPANTFGWIGPDPNTRWGGYQYRPLAELGESMYTSPVGTVGYSTAAQAVTDFLNWLGVDANWLPSHPDIADKWTSIIRKSAVLAYTTSEQATADQVFPVIPMGPPTDFPITGAEVNYPEPHMVALILRTFIYQDRKLRPNGNSTGPMPMRDVILLDKCIQLFDMMWVTQGVMAGTFSNDPDNHEWYGFWHGEIMTTLSQLLSWSSQPTINLVPLQQRAVKWLGGLTSWAEANSPTGESPWGESLWPFEPDWANGVSESFEYSTNIITSFDGHEQRISRRVDPRRGLTLRHTLYTQKDAASYQAILRARQNRPTLVPQWHLARTVSINAPVGQTYVDLRQAPDSDWKTGTPLLLAAGAQRQVNFVKGVEGNRVGLREPLQFAMSIGARVMVAYNGLLNTDLSSTKPSASYLQAEVGFMMLPQEDGRTLPVRPDDESWVPFISEAGLLWAKYIRRAAVLQVQTPLEWPTPGLFDMPLLTFTVNGETREVITRKPNWISELSLQDNWVYDVIEYFNGPVTPMEGENAGKRTIQARWTLLTADDQLDFLAMLKRLRGTQYACWLPSASRDFEMTRDSTALNILYVQNNSIIEEGLLDDSTVGISINTKWNAVLCARASTYTTGSGEIVITLDRNLPVVLKREDVTRISLLYRVRQATDKAEITWLTTDLAEVQVSFITVQE